MNIDNNLDINIDIYNKLNKFDSSSDLSNEEYSKNFVCVPSYIIKYNVTTKSNLLALDFLHQIGELCCDEYYQFIDLIDLRLFKFMSKYCSTNILAYLFNACGCNDSVLSFEYLKNKFNVKINKNFIMVNHTLYCSELERLYQIYDLIENVDKCNVNEYWKSKFVQYIIDNYELSPLKLMMIVKNLYLNKDLLLIKNIHKNFKTAIEIENVFHNAVKNQLTFSCLYNQFDVANFLIVHYKKNINCIYVDFILEKLFDHYKNATTATHIHNYNNNRNNFMFLDYDINNDDDHEFNDSYDNVFFALNFFINKFKHLINETTINNWLVTMKIQQIEHPSYLKLLKFIETNFVVNVNTYKHTLMVLFESEIDVLDVFYYIVNKIQFKKSNKKTYSFGLSSLYHTWNPYYEISWNYYYNRCKNISNSFLIKYLIDIDQIQIDLDNDILDKFGRNTNAYTNNKKYYFELKYKQTLEKRKKYVEYHCTKYKSKLKNDITL